MDRKYIYEMPNGKLTIVTSRNLDWEMSDDHILRTDLEIADHYRGQDNHVAYVDGHDIYQLQCGRARMSAESKRTQGLTLTRKEDKTMARTEHKDIRFDYDNQAWIVDGKYQRCGHPESMDCGCYGREHEGEQAPNIY